jgi:phage terminase large subunit
MRWVSAVGRKALFKPCNDPRRIKSITNFNHLNTTTVQKEKFIPA